MKLVMYIIHSLISVALIYMVLNQMSKYSELGGAFGSGSLYTLFSAKYGVERTRTKCSSKF